MYQGYGFSVYTLKYINVFMVHPTFRVIVY